ncbi:MAG: thiamine diphosphokinase [Ruminiclostridium sp.]
MDKGICYIIGAGSFYDDNISPEEKDYVIAADGGYRYTESLGIKPDVVIGDFDSLGETPDFPHVIKLKPEKDRTDIAEAVELGIEKGYSLFRIYGGTGGSRTDHTVANFQLLAYLSSRGMQGFLYGENEVFTAITDSEITFSPSARGYISVFAHSNICEGVTLKGLKYPLENYTLSNNIALGVSNEFTGVESSVSVKKGTLLIAYPKITG